MLLAVDIGNSNVTIGRFDGGVLAGRRWAPTDQDATPDAVDALLDGLLGGDGGGWAAIDALVVASVVPGLTVAVEDIASRRGLPCLVAGAGTVPIPIRVERPNEVGADRLVNAFAAARLHGAPAIVADFGTATTIDAVGADGAFLGGAIAPGLQLGLDALVRGTAQLRPIDLRAPDRAIGRDTAAAMQAGTVLGYQLLAGGLISRIRSELAEAIGAAEGTIRTIVTGGLSAAPWAVGIHGVEVIDPDLTLKGLALLHAETTARAGAQVGVIGA